MSSIDTAYTNLALEAHTDTAYFSDPIGLQMFHLLSHEDGQGGESLLVDGWRASNVLLVQDAEAFDILKSVSVHWHASGDDGINYTSYRGFPVFEDDCNGNLGGGQVYRIRWNNADRASIECPLHLKSRWYEAAGYVKLVMLHSLIAIWNSTEIGCSSTSVEQFSVSDLLNLSQSLPSASLR